MHMKSLSNYTLISVVDAFFHQYCNGLVYCYEIGIVFARIIYIPSNASNDIPA
jgi:hypothetical protein